MEKLTEEIEEAVCIIVSFEEISVLALTLEDQFHVVVKPVVEARVLLLIPLWEQLRRAFLHSIVFFSGSFVDNLTMVLSSIINKSSFRAIPIIQSLRGAHQRRALIVEVGFFKSESFSFGGLSFVSLVGLGILSRMTWIQWLWTIEIRFSGE